jgi:hypothetical protein
MADDPAVEISPQLFTLSITVTLKCARWLGSD